MRVYRIIAVAAAVALAVPGLIAARTLPIRELDAQAHVARVVSAQQQQQLRSLSKGVARAQLGTWRCQDSLQIRRTAASVSPWALPTSVAYRRWVQDRWVTQKASCEHRLAQRTLVTNDWVTAVRLVQRVFPGTADWLLYISGREGGHGGFVMNHQGSGAGGWMQFMASTYYAHNDEAFAALRARGFRVDERANSWYSPLGQAITAGYMRFTGKDGCHWCL